MSQKKLLVIFFVLFSIVSVGQIYSQVKISKTYESESIDFFSSDRYRDAVTRQHSITIDLKELLFSEIRDGDYILSMKLRFLNYKNGSSIPEVKREINTIFFDNELIRSYQVIEEEGKNKKKAKQLLQLNLKDKLLVFNHKLIDISHLEVIVKMTKAKDEFQSMINTIRPILNVALKSKETVALADNLLENLQSGQDDEPMLFRAEFYIPANIFDYEQHLNSNNTSVIKNNEVFGIVVDGKTPINDASFKGRSVKLINSISKFILGKEVLDKTNLNIKGLISLSFTKDQKPVIPDPINEQLRKINIYLEENDLREFESEFNTSIKETSKILEFAKSSETISPNTQYDISQYLRLAQLYYLFVTADNNQKSSVTSNISGSLVRSFKRWYDNINLKGAAYDIQGIGIKGIYNTKKDDIAKVFIPSGLNDFDTMSFYLWQKAIHEILSENKKTRLANRGGV